MGTVHHPPRVRVLAAALILTLVAGCTTIVDRLSEALYPTTSPQASESPRPTAMLSTPVGQATQQPTLAPTRTPAPQPSMSPTAGPRPEKGQHLVFARGGSIYRGDYLGEEATEVASLPQLEAWDFRQGLLVMTLGTNVDVADLKLGSLVSFEIETETRVEYAEVVWGTLQSRLLHAAVVSDADAPIFKRSVELRILDAKDGTELGKAMVRDVTGVSILRYDEELGRIALIPHGGDPSFSEVRYYDSESGALVDVDPVAGEGAAVLSPDGSTLLTEHFADEGTDLMLYSLDVEGQPDPRTWQPPQGSHTAWHAWSPDGSLVAFLLREGKAPWDESTRGLGLYVLDLSTMQASQVLEETGVTSSLVGWTPDGEYIIGYHRGETEDTYFYAVRPDGGDRRILTIGREAEILGWMPYMGETVVPKIVVDPWRVRFVQGMGDSTSTAEVVAQFVSEGIDRDDQTLSDQLRGYLEQAGWQFDLVAPSVKRVSDTTFVAQLPPMDIHVLEAGRPQRVATGDLVLDARQEEDDIGLVYGMIGAAAVQPAFVLLRRQPDATWQPLWTPQGQYDWIATDGEIRFAKSDLQRLEVIGSSFGLDHGDDQLFSECHACPHRRLVATWVRQGDGYVRQTDLPADAPLDQVLWEMTERSSYAILYECLRRLRAGLPADELVADASVLAQIEENRLADPGLRLMAEEETVDGVRFIDAKTQRHFQALVRGGRIVRVEYLSD